MNRVLGVTVACGGPYATSPARQTQLGMSSTRVFRVSAFGCNVQVQTACPEAYAILDRYVFPSLPRIAVAGKPDLLVRIVRVGNQWQLLADDAIVASAGQPISLVPDVIRLLDDAVIQRLAMLRAVHAGTVLWRGRALLLPGVSHAGKSSLVAELLRRGATYFSDEYALIDADGLVHPYPRPLLVRNGCPEQLPVLPEECNALVGDAPAPIGWIFALQYLPDAAWSVSPTSQSEALLNLLRNTPHILADSPDMVGAFQRAVAGAVCYAGHRGDAVHAAGQILQLISNPS